MVYYLTVEAGGIQNHKPMNKKTTAQLLVDTLEQAGVARIYGITGDSANYITDAISRSSIRFIHTRHEESAAFAAAAEAMATGRLTACIGSCGPGSLHLVNGLYEANRNGAPVMAIATEIHKTQIGTRFVQEIDTPNLFRGCSKFCEYVRSADQLPRLMGIAMQTAVSEAGVAVLIITAEVATEMMEQAPIHYLPIYTRPVIKPSAAEFAHIAQQINAVDKVTIYAGSGCRGGEQSVKILSEKIKAPIVWSYIARELFDFDSPYPCGMNGIAGTSAGAYALHHAELILLLGCGFAFTDAYPDHVPIIQIDRHGENLARRHFIASGVVGNIVDTIPELTSRVSAKSDNQFAAQCTQRYRTATAHLAKIAQQSPSDTNPIYPEHLVALLNDKLAPTAWITADMGTPWAFAGRYIESMGGRRFFCSSLHGTMAAALPFAIGLKVSHPDRQVVALCGDGGLSMLLGELISLVQEQVAPKIFVFNNSSLDFVAMEMKADGLLPSFTNLVNPDYAAVARSIGIKGIRVERVAELGGAIDEALADPGAVLVDVVVDKNSLLLPPQITAAMTEKFTSYAFKLVEHGAYEELLSEVLTNIRQV